MNVLTVGISAGIPTSGTGTVSTLDNLPNIWAVGAGTGATTTTQRVILDSSQASSPGQAAMSSSQSVAVASDQTAIPIKSNASGTGTQSIVVSTASAGGATILLANAARLGATVYNDSTQILYLILSATTPTTLVYTIQMAAASYYEVPFGYTGILKGIWASANGNARVTELT